MLAASVNETEILEMYAMHDKPAPDAVAIVSWWIGDANRNIDIAKQKGALWFGASAEVDAEIKTRFGGNLERASGGQYEDWLASPSGTLALILLYDQFTRNIFRGTAEAFGCDEQALQLCVDLQTSGGIQSLGWMSRVFALMPLQHSEDIEMQEASVAAFDQLVYGAPDAWKGILQSNADYAGLHFDIVKRFGRFPHRNMVLGRTSSEEEQQWLEDGAPTFGQG